MPPVTGRKKFPGRFLAGTVTTLAVFLPAVFLTGMIKYLFEPLSLAATLTIGASYILALTVVPAFCATFVREKLRREATTEILRTNARRRRDDAKPRGVYGRFLNVALKVPALTALLIVVRCRSVIRRLGHAWERTVSRCRCGHV